MVCRLLWIQILRQICCWFSVYIMFYYSVMKVSVQYSDVSDVDGSWVVSQVYVVVYMLLVISISDIVDDLRQVVIVLMLKCCFSVGVFQ